ncbi:MAG: hypothetical protein J6U10_02640, partial [Lachnospiraceae bacterium]|nr:hypothetical protein [Lachnospiraceae bacterium]
MNRKPINIFTGFVAVLAVAILLAGCGKQPTGQVSPAPGASGTPAPVTGTESPTQPPTATPTPTDSPKEALLKRLVPTDEKGVYDCPEDIINTADAGNMDLRSFVLDDGLVVYTYTEYLGEEERFSLISYNKDTLAKGKEVRNSALFSNASILRLGTKYIAVYEMENGKFHIYNGKLEEVNCFETPEGETYQDCTVDVKNEFFIMLTGSGSVYKAKINSEAPMLEKSFTIAEPWGEAASYIAALPGNRYVLSCGYLSEEEVWRDMIVYVDGSDGKLIDTDNGSFTRVLVSPDEESYVLVKNEPYYSISMYNADRTLIKEISLDNIREYLSATIDWTNRVILSADFFAGMNRYISQFKCYSMETGLLLSDCVCETETTRQSVFTVDTEKTLLPFTADTKEADDTIRPRICFWDYLNDGVEGKDDYFVKRTAVHDPVSDRIEALRNKIEEKYGVYLYIGYEIFGVELADSNATPLRDEESLFNVLTKLDAGLAKYPEGFFEQIREVCAKKIGFYIADDVTKDFGGYYKVAGYEAVIVIEVENLENPEKTAYHEISHMIDDYISRKGDKNGFEEGYAALNPVPSNEYYLSTYDERYITDAEAYTIAFEQDKENVYSVYQYGRTFPGEDRATLFEAALGYVSSAEDPDRGPFHEDVAKCRHLLEKLEYHFKAIRQCFDTSKWPEKTEWEKNLDRMKAFYEQWTGGAPAPTDAVTPTPTEAPLTPTVTPVPSHKILSKDDLLHTLTKTGQNAVYSFNAPYSTFDGKAEPYILEDGLVILYKSLDLQGEIQDYLVSYDKYTLAPQKELKDLWPGCSKNVYQYSDNGIMVLVEMEGEYEWSKKYRAYFYNGKLEEQGNYELKGVEYPTQLVFNEKTGLIIYADGSNSVYAFDTKTGKKSTFYTFNDMPGYVYDLYPSGEDAVLCVLSDYSNNKTVKRAVKLDVLKKEIAKKYGDEYSYIIENPKGDGSFVASTYEPCGFRVFDAAGNSLNISVETDEETENVVADWERQVLITTATLRSSNDAIVEFKCYSMSTGKLLSDCAVRATCFKYGKCALDVKNGLVYLAGNTKAPDGSTAGCVFVWDYINDGVEDKSDVFVKQTVITHKFSDRIEALRKRIEEKFNVYVYLGYEVADANFTGYDVSVCTREWETLLTLEQIEKVLGDYPDGFFEQLKNSGKKTLGIYLNGGMHGNDDYSVNTASGLALVIGYERALMVDVNYLGDLAGTMYHEITHWIDQTIHDAENSGRHEGFEEGFAALNPIEDYYQNSYADFNGNEDYTYLSAPSYDEVYSIDSYARTYPTEDRARLVEYLMDDGKGWSLYHCPNLMKKYDYYFSVIRETFDTTGWPEKTS